MAHLPDISYGSEYRQIRQGQFGGLKHCRSCRDGEIYDMVNVTLDEFPLLKTRSRRKTEMSTGQEDISALYVDNGVMLMIREYEGSNVLWLHPKGIMMYDLADAQNRQFVRFGNRVVLLPDMLMLNLNHKILGILPSTSDLPMTGNEWGDCYAIIEDVQVIGPRRLYVWDGTSWVDNGLFATPMAQKHTVLTAHFSGAPVGRFDNPGQNDTITFDYAIAERWLENIKAGDAVTISGCTEIPQNNKTAIIREINCSYGSAYIRFSENCFAIPEGHTSYDESNISISKDIPEMDFMFECNNRMWGAKGKTIYASKLGDPTNWYFFDGLSIDSWSVDTQTKGNILGGWGDYYPYFLREDGMTIVYGTTPAGYQCYNNNAIPGLMPGEERSIAKAGAYTIWRSRDGMAIYGNDSCSLLKDTFRDWNINSVIGVSAGMKAYFLSWQTTEQTSQNDRVIFCFDSATGLWEKQNGNGCAGLCYDAGCVYGLFPAEERNDINLIDGKSGSLAYAESYVMSMVEFGDVYCDTENRKAADLLLMRLEMMPNASLNVYVRYDGGTYELIETIEAGESGMKKKTIDIPITPHRCDHYNFMLIGAGQWTLYAMTASVRAGSERQ